MPKLTPLLVLMLAAPFVDSLLPPLPRSPAALFDRAAIDLPVHVHRCGERVFPPAHDTVRSARATAPTSWRGGIQGLGVWDEVLAPLPTVQALDAAEGDYVCFLDDDDLVTEDWLASFATAAAEAPGTMIRAVTLSQAWTTDGGNQPVRATGPVERPFADRFDLLAHLSRNETPLCSVALPRAAMAAFGLRFDEDLPVFEDWELFVRVAQLCGVTSISAETSLYRRLDHGNANTDEDEAIWHETHAQVIDRLSKRPVLAPIGDARRLASAHFVPGEGSRHDAELAMLRAEHDALTRSPLRMVSAFLGRVRSTIRARLQARRARS